LDDAKEKLNDRELNRIAVVERHKNTNRIGKGLVVDFLKRGTLASSYSHDSHNVVVVGNDPADMAVAVNFLKDIGGGFVAVENGKVVEYVMLNVAGIMGDDGEYILRKTESLEEKTKDWSDFENIFLSMSFLTLPVIPELKITDMGLVKNMEIVDLLI
jgi:adenine deaminase